MNMLNKMKICKWIIVAVAENGMREVYHCKLFAWFSFALHLKIKQRNSWYEHCIPTTNNNIMRSKHVNLAVTK